MSDPSTSNTSPLPLTIHHHRPATAPPLPLPSQPPSPYSSSVREYRKGNWSLHETLILITGKRLDDERRYPSLGGGGAAGVAGTSAGGRPAEQRWKWIENYCWNNSCHRSQNQCNDKWDNLLRDYKKVRDYESRVVSATAAAGEDRIQAERIKRDSPSYWTMERLERKVRNLPTNLAQEVFIALTDVIGRRATRRALPLALLPPPATAGSPAMITLLASPSASASPSPRPIQTAPPILPQAAPPPPPSFAAFQPSVSDAVDISESSESTNDDEPAPKRRCLGSSVVRSTEVLARTLLACEEKREKRHRELVELEDRKLRLEEQHAELHRQGFAGLISAVNNLSAAIHSLVTNRNTETGRV